MAVRVMRLAPEEMCTASYERAKAVPLARRVVLVMTQMAALFGLAPATIYVLLTELLKRHRCSSLRAVPLTSLQQDLEPVGTLEEVLVEKIAMEYWRLGIATWYEAGEFAESKPFAHTPIDRIMRYQTTINRQLYHAINQLERLHRLRKGDNVPAPLNLQVLHEVPTISDEENSDQ